MPPLHNKASTSKALNSGTVMRPASCSQSSACRTWQSKCVNCGDWYDQAVSFVDFEANLSGNLHKLWNRMSSGSYFPPPVRRDGGERDGAPMSKMRQSRFFGGEILTTP